MTNIKKDFNKEDIYKFHPREKIEYECENCGKQTIINAAGLFGKKKYLCWNCSLSGPKTRIKIIENSFLNSKEELPERPGRNRSIKIRFICEECRKENISSIGRFYGMPKLLCDKCYRKWKSQIRWGVSHPLQIFNKLAPRNDPIQIKKCRDGLVKNLWIKNFHKRKQFFETLGWKLENVNFDTMELTIKSDCCNTVKTIIMGTEDPIRWRCECAKKGHSSIVEQQFCKILKQLYPNLEIINSFKGWCIDPEIKTPNSYEIDIYFPKLNFGIEFCGCYWHDKKEQKREKLKIKRAKEVGIDLINIWEDDWKSNKTDIINDLQGEINERIKINNS